MSPLGTPGERTALMTHVVAATDPIGPVAPEPFTVEVQEGGARATWTSSASADNAASQIYVAEGTSSGFATAAAYGDPIASGPNVPLALDLILDPGSYSIFVVALDDDAPPVPSVPRGPGERHRHLRPGPQGLSEPSDPTWAPPVPSPVLETPMADSGIRSSHLPLSYAPTEVVAHEDVGGGARRTVRHPFRPWRMPGRRRGEVTASTLAQLNGLLNSGQHGQRR